MSEREDKPQRPKCPHPLDHRDRTDVLEGEIVVCTLCGETLSEPPDDEP